MEMLLLSAEELRQALPMTTAVAVVKQAFAALSTGKVVAPQRGVVEVEPGESVALLMGAYLPGTSEHAPCLASKTVNIFHGNRARGRAVVNGLVTVFDPHTGEPAALCDGTFLTAWRTGAASGAAADLLARPDARIGAVIGCGGQGRMQVMGIDAVRELEEIRLYALHTERVGAFAAELQPHVRARLRVVDSAEVAVEGADIVCAATNSKQPVVDGNAIPNGCHVNGIGSFTLNMREFDNAFVGRARVFVDTVEAALAEAGELVCARDAGLTKPVDWTELGLVAAQKAPGRQSPDEITFFKSVGQAVQDVACAGAALRRAQELGLGRKVQL